MNLVKHPLLKDSSWRHEKEWRVILGDCENIYHADLVTAIYLDESIEQSDEAKKLINLAKVKSWKVLLGNFLVIMFHLIMINYFS